MSTLQIYIGVAFGSNGGYGVVVTNNNLPQEEWSAGYQQTNVPRLYLHALLSIAKRVPIDSIGNVYYNNGYVLDSFNKGWLEGWHRKQFTKNKHPELWREIYRLIQQRQLKLTHIPDEDAPHIWAVEKAKKMASEAAISHHLIIDEDFSPDSNGLFINQREEKPIQETSNIPILTGSICVDASCIGNPGLMEYRAVDCETGKQIFRSKSHAEGTNNIGEFLAIVHALALNEKEQKGWQIIYTDSLTALSWVAKKKCKTKLTPTDGNKRLLEVVERAEQWLQTHTYLVQVLKWETFAWGEIPADYGRK